MGDVNGQNSAGDGGEKKGTHSRKRYSARRQAARRKKLHQDNAPKKTQPHRTESGGAGEKRQDRTEAASEKRRKRAVFDVVSGSVLIVSVCVFVFALYMLVTTLAPYYTGGKEYDEIQDLAVTADGDGGGFGVDFDALLEINPDTVAWIRFDEPSIINYPVVKSADNEEYLKESFSGDTNVMGAIFMDMDNKDDFSDKNTIIYGHHFNASPEMFSRLHLYEDEDFCKEHPDFYIYTPDGSVRTYTVFAAGVSTWDMANYMIDFSSDEEFEQYIADRRAASNYQVDVEVNADSQIVTLSTCTGVQKEERFILQGVLTAVD